MDQPPDTADNAKLEIVGAAYERFNEGDIEGVLELLHDDIEMPDVHNDTILRGKEAVRRNWQKQFALADHRALPGSVVDVGSAVTVVVYHQVYEPGGGPFGPGVAAVHRLSFRDDRIVKMEFTSLDEIPDYVQERLR